MNRLSEAKVYRHPYASNCINFENIPISKGAKFINYQACIRRLLFILFFFGLHWGSYAQCPTILIDDMNHVPGYPKIDDVSVCGVPDTITYYLLNSSGQDLLNSEFTLSVPPGMAFAEFFEYVDPSYPVLQGDWTDLNEPTFVIPMFGADSVQIMKFGVIATCEVYNLPPSASFEYDATFDFIYNHPTDGLIACSAVNEGDLDYAPFIKTPTLNILSVSPADVRITNDVPRCTNVTVAQNGIGASLTNFTFEIYGLHLAPDLGINSMTIGGVALPFTHDTGTEILTAEVDDSYLPGGSLGEDESVVIRICYEEMLFCETTKELFNLTYAASFGCGETSPCTSPSLATGTLQYAPNFGANPVIDVTTLQLPAICGDSAIFRTTISSTQTDPLLGVFNNLEVGLQICEADAFNAAQVTINGVPIDPNAFYYQNFDFVINTTLFTSDPDGPGGLDDTDGDGFFDDLPGGETLTMDIYADIKCQDPTQISGCAAIDCTFDQAFVKGERHCGSPFQVLPKITPAPVFSYGAVSVTMDETNVGSASSPVDGYEFAVGSTTTESITMEYCYEFGTTGVGACQNGQSYFEFELSGPPVMVLDVEIDDASVTFDGAPVPSSQINTFYSDSVGFSTKVFQVFAGSNDLGRDLCYNVTFEVDSCICYPATFAAGNARVVEECFDCTPESCTIVRSCYSTLVKSTRNCSCSCFISREITSVRRTNFGFADRAMTIPLDETTAAPSDLAKFLPCDTALVEVEFEVLNDFFVESADEVLFQVVAHAIGGNNFTPGMDLLPDFTHAVMDDFSFEKANNPGTRTKIDFSGIDCTTGFAARVRATKNGLDAYGFEHHIYNATTDEYTYQSTWDVLDNTRLYIYIYDRDRIAANGGNQTYTGDCLSHLYNDQMGGVDIGDKFHIKVRVPLQKNPYREENADIAAKTPQPLQFLSYANFYQTLAGSRSNLGGACGPHFPVESFCPKPIIANTEYNIDDCSATVEHTFKLSDNVPVDWYVGEYRPYYHFDQIQVPLISPLVYAGNAEAILADGTVVPLSDPTFDSNATCAFDSGQTYCTSNADSTAYGTFTPYELPTLGLGLTGDDVDSLTIRYDLAKLCPGTIDAPASFALNYGYNYGCEYQSGGNYCGRTQGNAAGTYAFFSEQIVYPTSDCPGDGGNLGQVMFASKDYHDFVDTSYTLNFKDSSLTLPPLSSTVSSTLIADLAGISEEVTYQVCAGSPGIPHENVLTTVTLPSTVSLLNITDLGGTPIVFTQTGSTPTHTTYTIELPDLNPTDCYSFNVETELIFCPIPGSDTEVCIKTSSSCLNLELASQLLSGGGSACTSTASCYEYVSGEAELQNTWTQPMGGVYPLCADVPFELFVKNTKVANLIDLEFNIVLPAGLEIIPLSFEYAYPGGPNFGTWESLPNPTLTGTSIYGDVLSLDDSFMTYINANGLPGITVSENSDSNKVAIRFMARTICDEYTSNTPVYAETTAADPCESRITAGWAVNPGVVINNAIPLDNAQFLIIAEPLKYTCGATVPVSISGINLSTTGGVTNMTTGCFTFPPELDYVVGSFDFGSPGTHVPTNVEENALPGGFNEICFDLPDGMGPQEFFSFTIDLIPDGTIACQELEYEALVRSRIEDQVCVADNSTCDVFVNNTINQYNVIQFINPVEIGGMDAVVRCDNDPTTTTLDYTIHLEGILSDYIGDIEFEFYRDIDLNGVIDSYDQLLHSNTVLVNVPVGAEVPVSGTAVIQENLSCPLIVRANFDLVCECNSDEFPFDFAPTPDFLDGLGSPVVLCPGDDLILDVCEGYTFEMIAPTSMNPVVPVGNVLTLGDFPTPYGTSVPATLRVTSQLGDCAGSWDIEIYQLDEFEIGPYTQANACNMECTELDLGIPNDWLSNVTIEWSPTTYLDDPTSATPTICNPVADIIYTVTVTNPSNGCVDVAQFPVNVVEFPVPAIAYEGFDECFFLNDPAHLTATPTGLANYEFYYTLGGLDILVQTGPDNEYILPSGIGSYYVIASDGFCGGKSETIDLNIDTCSFDLALVKTLSPGQPTPFYTGDIVSFEIKVFNQGTIAALDINVIDYIPAGLQLADAAWNDLGSNQASIVIAGPLAAGDSSSVSIDLEVLPTATAGNLSNFAEISSVDDADGAGYTDLDSTPDGDDSNDGTVTDDATDSANGDEDDHDVAEFPVAVFDLALTKQLASGQTTPVSVGDDVTYDIEICNQGTVDAYNIDVVDYMPAGMVLNDPAWSSDASGNAFMTFAGPLASMGCTTVPLTVTIASYPASGAYDNFAEIADAEDVNGNHPTDLDSTPDSDNTNDGPVDDNVTDGTNGDEDDHDIEQIAVVIYDLELDKALSATQVMPVNPGDDITFTLTVTNTGTADAYTIGLVDYIPTGLTLNDADWAENVAGIADLNVPIPGPLAPNATATVDITFTIDATFMGNSITNNAEISEFDNDTDPNNTPPADIDSDPDSDLNNDGPTGEDDEDDLTFTVEQIFDLALTKALGAGQTPPFAIGTDVTFDIEVCNQGTLDAYNVDVVDYIPTGMSLNDATWALDVAGNAYKTIVGPLAPNTCETVSIILTIDSYPPSGSFLNYSEIADAEDADGNHPEDLDSTADNDSTNDGPIQDGATDGTNGDEDDHDVEEIPVYFFDLELDKAISATQVYPINPGDDVTYTLTVSNTGTVDAYSINLVDYIPTGLTLNDAAWTENTTGIADLNTAIPGPLAPNATTTVDVTFTVDPTFTGTTVNNTAEISSADDDTDPNNTPPTDIDSTPDNDETNDGPDGEDDEDDAMFMVSQTFDLNLTKALAAGQPNPVTIGDDVVYDIEVCNEGTIDAYNVDVVDYIPTGMSLNDATWALDANGNAFKTIGGPLLTNACAVVSITLTIDSYPPSGSYDNFSEIADAEDVDGNHPEDIDSTPDSDDTNDGPVQDGATDGTNGDEDDHDIENIAVVVHDLELDKAISATQTFPLNPGDDVTFTLTVTNAGTVDAYAIGLVDYIPAGLILNDANWTETTPGIADLTTAIPGPLASGTFTTVDITFTIDADFTGTSITNNAEISSFDDDTDPTNDPPVDIDSTPDGMEGNDGPAGEDDEDDETIEIEQIHDLALRKTLSATQTFPVTIGDDVTFTVEVCNQGTVDAHNVTIVDHLPQGLLLNDPNWTPGVLVGDAYYQFPAVIAKSTCVTVDIITTITEAPATGEFTNSAEINSAENPDGTKFEDVDSEFDDDPDNDGLVIDDEMDNGFGDEDDSDIAKFAVEVYDLELAKAISPTQVMPVGPGDDITFTLTVTNAGNVDAYSIGLVDYVPTGLTLNDANWVENTPGIAELVTLVPGPVAPMGVITVDITFTIDATFMGASITNNAEISEFDNDTDPSNTPPVDQDSTPDDTEGNDGAAGEDDEDDVTFPIEQIFDLALTKTLATGQPTPVTIGDDVTYQIEVCNQGTIDAYNVEVVDYIPTGMTLNDPAWMLNTNGAASSNIAGPIATNSCEQVTITLTVVSFPASGYYDNYSEIGDAEDVDGNHPQDVDSNADNDPTNDGAATDNETDNNFGDEDDHDFERIPVIINDLELDKSVAATQTMPVAPGDDITFTLTVTNAGTVDAYSIALIDNMPAGLFLNDADWTENTPGVADLNTPIPGPLAPNATASVDITFTIDASFMGAAISNSAEIGSFDDDTDPTNDPPTDTDSTPDNDDPSEDDQDEETFQVEQTFDLALTKALSAAQTVPVAVGDDVTYTIEVCNQGTLDAYNVEVVDYLPAGMSLNDPNWVMGTDPGEAYTSLLGPISPNTCEAVDIIVTIDFFPASGNFQNVAEISEATDIDGNPQPDVDSTPDNDPTNDGSIVDDETGGEFGDEDDSDLANLPVVMYDLELAKEISPTQTFPVSPGDDVTFTLTVTNASNADVYNIGLTDYIPTGLVLNDANWVENTPGLAELATLIPGPLAANATTSMNITFTIEDTFTGTTITNNAEISEFDNDTDPSNTPPTDSDSTPDTTEGNDGAAGEDDEDDATFPIEQTFDLALTKVISPTQPLPVVIGDMITYDLEICNQGTLPAYNVEVVDYMPADMALADANWTIGSAPDQAYTTYAGPLMPGTCAPLTITLELVSISATSDLRNVSEISGAEDVDGNPQTDVDGDFDDDPTNDGQMTDNETDGGFGDEDNSDFADTPFAIHDLELDKALASTQTLPVGPGDDVTFTLTVTNAGTVDAYSIQLVDYTPIGFVLNDANWVENTPGVAELVTPIPGPLAASATTTMDITFTIDASFMGTSITNNAEISSFDDDTDPTNDPPVDIDSTPDGNEGNDGVAGEDDEDDETIPVGQVFDLALTKVLAVGQPIPVQVGDNVTYTIEVCNQGTLDAYNVEVVDYLPSGMSLNDPNWIMGTDPGEAFTNIAGPIAPNACAAVDIIVTIDFFPASGNFQNMAEISGAEDVDGNPQTDVDGAYDNDPTNDGNIVDGETGNEFGDEDDSDIADLPVVMYDLELAKEISPSQTFPVNPGDDVTFTLTVTNASNADVYSIGLVDYIPTGLALNDANWVENTPGLAELATLIPGPLAANATTTMDITFTIEDTFTGTTITNNAEISEFDNDTDPTNTPPVDSDSTPDSDEGNDGAAGEDDEDDATFPIEQIFDLALTKVISPTQPLPVVIGDMITYDLEICNQGTLPAYNVEVVDYMPADMALADANWTIGSAPDQAYTTYAGPLMPGTCTPLTITLELVSISATSDLRNVSEISGAEDVDGNPQTDVDGDFDDDPTNDGQMTDNETDGGFGDEDNSDYAETPFAIHDLELDKALAASQTLPVAPGDDVTFTLTVTNAGTVDAYSIQLVDYVPTGFVLNDANWVENTPGAAELVTPIAGPLAASATTSVDITFTIDASFMGTSITNNAEISSFDDDTDPTNDPPVDIDSTPDGMEGNDGTAGEDDEDHELIPIEQTFDLALTKIVAPTQPVPVAVGDDVTYTIEVCNQGTLDAYNVTIVDYLPTGMSLNDANWVMSTDPGEANTLLAGPITPNMCMTVDITVTIDFFPASGNYQNVAEISSAEDVDGNLATDVDSDYDDDPTNDGAIIDGETDNNFGDEDDSDLANLPVICNGPVASINAVDTLCIGGVLELSTNDIADAYSWNGPNGFTSTEMVPDPIDPVTLQDGGFYTLQITESGCVSAVDSFEVVVSAGPEKPTIACTNCPVCDGEAMEFVTSTNGVKFEWIGPLGASQATLTIPGLTTTVGTTSIGPGHPSYLSGPWQVVVYDEHGCGSEMSAPVNAEILSIPDAPIPASTPVCEGGNTELTSNTIPGATYNWYDGTATTVGNLISNDQNPVISGLSSAGSPHTYWLSVSIEGCASDTIPVSVIINENPMVVASNDGTECIDPLVDVGLFATASLGDGDYTYDWTGPNGFASTDQNPVLPNAMNNLSGTYQVVVTDGNGCVSDPATTIVDITVNPDLPVIQSTAPACMGEQVTLSVQQYTGNTISYAWTGPNGPYPSTTEIVIDPTSASDLGQYTIVVTVDGCDSDVSEPYVLEMFAQPVAPSPSNNSPICAGQDLLLSANPPAGVYTYLWEGPNGFTSTLENPIVPSPDANDAGSYQVTIYTTDGCSSTATTEVVIGEQPVTPTIAAIDAELCDTEALVLTTSAYSGINVLYTWTAPDASITTTTVPSVTYNPVLPGEYSVMVTVEGCNSLISAPEMVTVTATPAMPSLAPSFTACEGGVVLLTTSTIADEYLWTGPNGFVSTVQNPMGIEPAATSDAGVYTLVVTNNGCSSPAATTQVVVNANPEQPTIASNSPICKGDDLILTTSSVCVSYQWIGPDGASPSTLMNPLLTTTTNTTTIPEGDVAYDMGMWSVICIDANGCTSVPSEEIEVVINEIPAAPTASNNTPICEGSDIELAATFIAGGTYSWTGPNGFTSTDQNPVIYSATPVDNGIYNVDVTVNGCTSSLAATNVVVDAHPVITGITGGGTYCEGTAVLLTANPIAGSTYSWTGPNGFSISGQATPDLTIDPIADGDEGTYSLVITTAGNCVSDPASVIVKVNSQPATPTIANNGPLCEGDDLVLTTDVYNGNGIAVSYIWTQPDGSTVTTNSPSHTILGASLADAGDYTIVIDQAGCVSLPSAATTVVVHAIPAAPIVVVAQNTVCEGDVIDFHTTTVADSYTWVGPNGYTSTTSNPAAITPATLADAGMYSLVVTTNGCTSPAATVAINVNATPATPTIVSNSPICEGDDIVLSTSSVCANYQWIGPDGNSPSTLANPLLTTSTNTTTIPFGDDAYDEGMWGVICLDANACASPMSAMTEVVINEIPAPVKPLENGPLCEGEDLYLTAPFVAGASYEWIGPNGFTSTQQNPTITNVSMPHNGDYFVYITVNGCTSAISDPATLIVHSKPIITNLTGGGSYCEGGTALLDADPITGGMCTWTGPNGFYLTNLVDPQLVFSPLSSADEGTYTLTITTADGCVSVASSVFLAVKPQPTTPSIANNGPLCEGTDLELTTDLYTGANAVYTWTTPSGQTTTSVPQLFVNGITTADAGNYSVEVMVDGCPSLISPVSVVQVTSQPAQPANIQSNSPICNGDAIYLTVDAVPNATYTWYGPGGFTSSAQNPIIANANGLDNGDYYVNVTINGCVSVNSDTLTMVVNDIPVAATVSNDGPACEGGVISLSATGSTTASYTWYDANTGLVVGTGNPLVMNNLTMNNAGNYHALVEENGCTSLASNNTAVIVNPVPTDNAFAGADQVICQVTSTNLNAIVPTQGSGFWTQVSGPSSVIITPTDSGTPVVGLVEGNTYEYVWTLSNVTCANYSADTVSVNVSAALMAPAAPQSNSPICEGNAIYLTADFVPGATYQWYGPNGFSSTIQNPIIASAVPIEDGAYYYEITINGCTSPASATTQVDIISELIAPVISSNSPVCGGSDIELYATGPAGVVYEWFNSLTGVSVGTGNPLVIPNATNGDADDYYAVAHLGSCTSGASEIESIIVSDGTTPDNAYAGDDVTFCGGESVVQLDAGVALFAEGLWTQVSGPDAVIVTPTDGESMIFEMDEVGTYVFAWTLSNGICPGYSADTVTIVKEPLPEANDNYYEVPYNTVFNTANIVDNDMVDNMTWEISLIDDVTVGDLELYEDGTFRSDSPNYVGLDSFTYKICNPNCPEIPCVTAKVILNIGFDKSNECVVPNIITPNGDNENETLMIHCLVNYPNNKIRVYNRWGDLVYNAGPYNNDWAGTFNNNPLPEGTYFYILELDPVNDPSNVLQGFVTVHR